MMIQLIDGWRFQLKNHASDVPSDWHTKETKDWSEVNLPHLWTMDDRFDEDSPIYTNVVMPFRHEPPELPQKTQQDSIVNHKYTKSLDARSNRHSYWWSRELLLPLL